MTIKKRIKYQEVAEENLNVWPSFTDLMANAFMIISLFLLLALFKSLFLKYTADETQLNLSTSEQQIILLQREIALLEREAKSKNETINRLKENSGNLSRLSSELQTLLERSNSRLNIVESEVERLKSAPPIVVIQDSGEYQFASGSATLPQELKNYISIDLVERIEQISRQRNLYVVEIIGHTDGQVNFNGASNLDRQLESVAQGKQPISSLTPGSNADLGLMRALEVVKQLQLAQQQGRLAGVQFRAYSAAQLQLPTGDFAGTNRDPDANRRRIEIRFSPLGKAETIR
ncbi:Flagellar motor protein [Hyella patelloides LEGE 07179]|uniref:Flagellar motor protein n=1 Tax=Hyella patelloides LEGE 07179 TaxID=945734 RepID=A0A563VW32_9CYAN|nr:flagellar motor protein [Hyella patelloides]VEP15652.1 Flagellar motor protein [Hyella patelloides LEGE 07179]